MSRDAPTVYRLQPNERTEQPTQWCFVDTETAGIDPNAPVGIYEQALHFGVACFVELRHGKTYEDWLTFQSSTDFWDAVVEHTDPKQAMRVVAHNMGGFDYMVLRGEHHLERLGYPILKRIMGCPPFVIKARKDDRTIVVLDNLNWFRMSLAALGKYVGIEKGTDPGLEGPYSERIAYCRTDVMILKENMLQWLRFLKQNQLGNFAITAAGQAMNAFRHRFMPDGMVVNHDPRIVRVERTGYFGGRTEAFRIGKVAGPIMKVDVTSMYPHVMSTHNYPIRCVGSFHRNTLDELKLALRKGMAVMAEVVIRTEVPAFPYRGETVEFPLGTFETVLTTGELKLALKVAEILEVRRVNYYEAGPVFVDFVDHFWKLRKQFIDEGNATWAWLTKLMMNSLYGKFGQRQPDWTKISTDGMPPIPQGLSMQVDVTAGTTRTFRRVGSWTEEKVRHPDEARSSMTAIAAHVTAYARLYLWELMERAKRQNVFYVDTDSLFVNGTGFTRLRFPRGQKVLGSLTLEEVTDNLVIRTLKDYTFGQVDKVKGLRHPVRTISANQFVVDSFRSFKGAIAQADVDRMIIRRHEKTLKRDYRKGQAQTDGSIVPNRYEMTLSPIVVDGRRIGERWTACVRSDARSGGPGSRSGRSRSLGAAGEL